MLTKPINNSRSLVLSNFDILHFHQLGQTSSFKTLSITYWQQGSTFLETTHYVSVSSPSLVDCTLKWWEGAYGLQGPIILGPFIKSTSRLSGSNTQEGEFQVTGWKLALDFNSPQTRNAKKRRFKRMFKTHVQTDILSGLIFK